MQQPGERNLQQTPPPLNRQGKRQGASRSKGSRLPKRQDHPLSRKNYRRLVGWTDVVQQRGASGRQMRGLYVMSRDPRCWRV